MRKRDKGQERAWNENRKKIMQVIRDHELHRIGEVAKLAELTRGTVYKHLNAMTKTRIIIKENHGIRLGPLYPMPEAMVQGLHRILENWPDQRKPCRIELHLCPGHDVQLDSNGKLHHIIKLSDTLVTRDHSTSERVNKN